MDDRVRDRALPRYRVCAAPWCGSSVVDAWGVAVMSGTPRSGSVCRVRWRCGGVFVPQVSASGRDGCVPIDPRDTSSSCRGVDCPGVVVTLLAVVLTAAVSAEVVPRVVVVVSVVGRGVSRGFGRGVGVVGGVVGGGDRGCPSGGRSQRRVPGLSWWSGGGSGGSGEGSGPLGLVGWSVGGVVVVSSAVVVCGVVGGMVGRWARGWGWPVRAARAVATSWMSALM